MKSPRSYLLPALAAVSLVPAAWAQKEITIRRLDQVAPPHGMMLQRDDSRMEKEQVTFLGVMTAPVSRTLAAQLGLPRDTGLVVTGVSEKSPATEILKEDDVLTKLDDQILVNQHQLGVLVRAKKEGEEVKLTVVRGGKETTVKAKLASHEVPKLAGAFFQGAPGTLNLRVPGPGEGGGDLEWLGNLPGMDAGHARDVLRMIGKERGNFFAGGPRMRIIGRAGKGTTLLDMPNSNVSYSDDEGSIEIKSEDKQRSLTIKDAKGKVTFQGPINTPEERNKLPAEVKDRIAKLDGDTIGFEAGEDFKPEVVPLPGEPAKTKIRQEIGRPGRPATRPL